MRVSMKTPTNTVDSENTHALATTAMIRFGVTSWLYRRCKVIDRKRSIPIRVTTWKDTETKTAEITKNAISTSWTCLHSWLCRIRATTAMYNGWVKKPLLRSVTARLCIRIFAVVGIDEAFCRAKIMAAFPKIAVKVSKPFRMHMAM